VAVSKCEGSCTSQVQPSVVHPSGFLKVKKKPHSESPLKRPFQTICPFAVGRRTHRFFDDASHISIAVFSIESRRFSSQSKFLFGSHVV